MTRAITRYANRKLYDSRTRGYITLTGIARAVAKGEVVRVLDRDSGTDLTAQTLLQAMLDQEKAKTGTFSAGALSGMIRASSKKKARR